MRQLVKFRLERNIMDSVEHGATHHSVKIHRKEDGKVTEKGNGKGTQKGGKFKGGKGGNQGQGKCKGKKGQRLKRNHRTTRSGQMDHWNNGQNNLGMLKQTLRVGDTMIGTQQIRIHRPQRRLRNFNMRLSVICDSLIWVLSNTANYDIWY